MFTFYFFGRVVENYLNPFGENPINIVFIIFYLSAIVVSEIPTYFKHKNNPNYNSLGASGAVSAILFASIMIAPTNMILIYGIIPIPGFALGILYLIYSYFMGKKGRDNINHDAHLYGAIYGIIFIIITHPEVIQLFISQLQNFSFHQMIN